MRVRVLPTVLPHARKRTCGLLRLPRHAVNRSLTTAQWCHAKARDVSANDVAFRGRGVAGTCLASNQVSWVRSPPSARVRRCEEEGYFESESAGSVFESRRAFTPVAQVVEQRVPSSAQVLAVPNKPPEFDRENAPFVTGWTRFESSWWHCPQGHRTMRWPGVTSSTAL